MMIKHSDIPGTKVVKGYRGMVDYISKEMSKIHDNVHNQMKNRIKKLKVGEAPNK